VDDIVERLRDFAEIVEQSKGEAVMVMLSGDVFVEAVDKIERLQDAIDTVLEAINNAGPVIGHHTWISVKHRREWPTLWNAIDQLREAKHE
jgi:hypothetical protein